MPRNGALACLLFGADSVILQTIKFYGNGDFMLKEATYKQKFAMLTPLMAAIIEEIKKEIKNDHLRNDHKFCGQYFPSKHVAKLTVPELQEGYLNALQADEHSEIVGDFLAQRWIVKKADVYNFFETMLMQISPEFSELTEIELPKAQEMVSKSVAQFGPVDVYLFSVLNAVVFPEVVFNDLKKQAIESWQKNASTKSGHNESQKATANSVELARLTEKYEKKLSDLQAKYHRDTQNLKKQIANLQRKLQHG